MTEAVSAPIATAASVRLGAADLLDVLAERMLNYTLTPAEEWLTLATEAATVASTLRVPPENCPRCIGRDLVEPTHVEACPLRNPPELSRDEQIAAMEAATEAVPEAYRQIVRDAETARIDALFACGCPKEAPKKTPKGEADKSFAGRVRQATDRMKAVIVTAEGKPDVLRVAFANGEVKTWDLPAKSAHALIKDITAGAIGWAKEQGATDGQAAAVRKALTESDYFTKAK